MASSTTTRETVEAELDRRLLREIAQGSTESLGRLYDRHAGIVYGLARRILRSDEDAEEIVQDVFAQAWRHAARYETGRATVAGWLVMMTRTRAIDRVRARVARPDLGRGFSEAPGQVASARPGPEQVSISTEAAVRVRKGLRTLPANQRSLLELAFFEGLTHKEIAHKTGVPLGTVKTRLRSAMTILRQTIVR